MEEKTAPQPEKSKYEYGPGDKPKGKATVVADDPIDLFPPEHADLEQITTK
jgi:hypothetical protein